MSTQKEKGRLELLQGTLDLLILRTLIYGPQHGRGIGRGWIAAEWEVSTNNRKARFYVFTPAGRQQPVKEVNKWRRLAAAVGWVLGPEAPEGKGYVLAKTQVE